MTAADNLTFNNSENTKDSEKFCLPEADIISDWFSQDQLDRLKKIHGSDLSYSKYSVYERYKDSKGAL